MRPGEIYKLKDINKTFGTPTATPEPRTFNTVYRFKLVNYIGHDTWEIKILQHDIQYGFLDVLHHIRGSNIMAYYELEA